MVTRELEGAHAEWHRELAEHAHDLAARFGTPFFVYDTATVHRRIERVRRAFGDVAKVYYAVKTNPNLELLRSLRGVADGLDISSGGELAQAEEAGHDPDTLSFAGPAKTVAELQAAVEKGVGCISVESEREVEALREVAGTAGRRANVLLRVNPELLVREFGMKMGGKAVQFGVDEEAAPSLARRISADSDHFRFRGIHVYAGSQCFEPAGIESGVLNTLRIARTIEAASGLPCELVNFGGGFGVAHGELGRELDVVALGRALEGPLREFLETRRGSRLVFELGRYLMADAGVYVVRVIDRKVSRGKQFVLVDGGLHHHLAAGGMFGVGLRSNYPLVNLSRPDAQTVRCNLAGPLCNPTDLLGVNVQIPEPRIGDLIAVLKSGSYAYSASPLLFLGRPTPAEIIRDGGAFRLGRRSYPMQAFN